MDTDADLPTLISRKDHLNVLRYIRVFELREPALVVEHGQAWLGKDLKRTPGSAVVRRTALEQIACAALDLGKSKLASFCLDRLKEQGVPADAVRFKRLLARCLEAAGDISGAELMYKNLLQDTPANVSAMKREYALLKSKAGEDVAAHAKLVEYLTKFPSDASAWYELAELRKALGDFKAAAYCLEEVLLASSPLDANLHVELAECYATAATNGSGGKHHNPVELLLLARQHMAQALELDPLCTRAQWGLLQCSNMYLEQSRDASKKHPSDPFQDEVAQALLEHAAAALQQRYRKTPLEATVKQLCQEFLDSGDGDEI